MVLLGNDGEASMRDDMGCEQRAEELLYCGTVIGTTPTRLYANGANQPKLGQSLRMT